MINCFCFIIIVFGESETINYGAIFQLCCPVDAEKAKSTYKNGLLKIVVPYADILKDTIDVKIEYILFFLYFFADSFELEIIFVVKCQVPHLTSIVHHKILTN